MKRFTLILLLFALLLTGCSREITTDEEYVFSWGGNETYSDNGTFYTKSSTAAGGDVICRYSADTGLSIPLCNKPDCTHNIIASPNCNALANQPKGIFSANGKLYFMEIDKQDDDLNIICADINGGNRNKIAVIKHGMMSYGFIGHMRYSDGSLILTSYDIIDTELLENANEIKTLDKHIATVKSINVASGEVKTLVKCQGYNAKISNAVIDGDTLIYTFAYNTVPPSDGSNYTDDEWNDTYRYGVFCVNMNTGEEKCLTEGYDRMTLANPCFDYFSYDRLIFFSTDTNKLYKYNNDDGSLTPFAECANINTWYISDDKYALFLENENDDFFRRYDFESGNIINIPRENFLPVYLNGVISGEKVWLAYTDDNDEYCMGYMSRDDLMNGCYDNFKFAYYVNSEV